MQKGLARDIAVTVAQVVMISAGLTLAQLGDGWVLHSLLAAFLCWTAVWAERRLR